ncbi:MAG TPA: hypothetical protein VGR85_02635 [Candidatus Limnocylindria bacterium]|nr:hypothetical protein [Candidatus Limnocylindria bacterium]
MAPIVALAVAVSCQAETPVSVTPTFAAPSTAVSAAPSPRTSPTPEGMTAEGAIRAVLAASALNGSTLFAVFPTSVGSHSCQIRGGGPPPGISVPGTCRTEVEASGFDYIVRFVETWDASRFHYAGEPGSGELQHTWSFAVSGSGTVVVQPDTGSFPPQWVR